MDEKNLLRETAINENEFLKSAQDFEEKEVELRAKLEQTPEFRQLRELEVAKRKLWQDFECFLLNRYQLNYGSLLKILEQRVSLSGIHLDDVAWQEDFYKIVILKHSYINFSSLVNRFFSFGNKFDLIKQYKKATDQLIALVECVISLSDGFLIHGDALLVPKEDANQITRNTKLPFSDCKELYEYIYIASVGEGLIKIGKTTDLAKRQAQYATHTPFVKIKRAFFTFKSRNIESAAHETFSKVRVQGEFFAAPEKDAIEFLRKHSFSEVKIASAN